MRGKQRVDMMGRVFGQLAVIGPSEVRNGRTYWWCACTCGVTKWVGAPELVRGTTVSCGLHRGAVRGAQMRTHGEAYKNETPEHRVWGQMHGRCRNKNNKAYKDYGGRGIRVCERWSGPAGYQNFLEDMGRRPTPKHQIERKDNDGPYAPENCIWATQLTQAANRRSNHRITFNGETLHLAAWALRHGLKPPTLRMRLKRGLSMEEALEPVKK